MSNGRRIDRTWFHKKAVKRFSLFGVHLCLWIIPILISGTLCAQTWTKLHTFDGYICLAKFLDANTGFVGFGVSPGKGLTCAIELDKTTDGGKTWVKATIPGGYGGEIGDILMVDSLHGWLAMTAWNGGNSALWRTSDAGLTWNETSLAGSGTSVRITPSAMVVTDLLGDLHISTDGGNTFTTGTMNSTNCVSFVDPLHGVISDFRGENWLTSADGGVTWQKLTMTVEAWSVYGDSGTSNFYAAPEGPTNGTGWHGIIYHSTDYGATWGQLASFPFIFTGHLTGIRDQYLFMQVTNVNNIVSGVAYNGFYYSTDQGVSWTSIGGPSALNDTRFSVIDGCNGPTLYGFDTAAHGSLFEYSFGSGGSGIPQQLHREAASAYVGQLDSLVLGVDIDPQLNLDSLWPYITAIQATYSWDSSVVKYAGYLPPSGWILNGLANHGNSVDIDIQNNAPSPTAPLDLGTALFRPTSNQLATTWVELPSLVFDIGTQTLSLCVTDNEDNHWAVKTLGVESGVSTFTLPSEDIRFYPNPASNELYVQNASSDRISVMVYDEIGRIMMSISVEPSATNSISLESLPSGPYFFVSNANGHTETRCITKE